MREMKDSGTDVVGIIPTTWTSCRLKYLCNIQTGNEDTQNADPDGEYPFYIRSPIIEKCKRYTFEGEGILMAGDGAGAGRVFHHAYGKYAVHQRVYRLSDFKNFDTDYFYYYLSKSFIKRMVDVDPDEIIRRGKMDFSTNRAALRYARVILSKYNSQQRGGRKLPYRFKG